MWEGLGAWDPHVRCTWTPIPPWGMGVHSQEPEEALPEDSPAFRVAAAAFSVLGDGQLVPGHLTGKGHTIQLPRFPVRWKGPGRVEREVRQYHPLLASSLPCSARQAAETFSLSLPLLLLRGSHFTTMVATDCGSGFEPPRAAATASTWESNVGKQPFTEKAISLQVYAQSSCWGSATKHSCQTNSTQKVIGPGLALLTPSFSWEKRPESKAEPPDERQIESETEVSAFTPGLLPPYQNPRHSPEGPGLYS